MGYLYLIQILRLILPLSLLSILTDVLKADQYGVYVYTLSCAAWMSIFVEYGFNISATRRIAESDEVVNQRSTVVQTQAAKLILSVISSIFLVWALYASSVYETNSLWAFAAWILGVLMGLMPNYYYQGRSQLKAVAITEVTAGIFIVAFTTLLIRDSSKFWCLGIILLVARLSAWYYLQRKMMNDLGIRYGEFLSLTNGMISLRDGWRIFLVQAAASIYTSFNVVLLGVTSDSNAVAAYGSSERLVRAGLSFIAQATNAIFPHFNRMKIENPEKLKNARVFTLIAFVFGSFIAAGIIHAVAPYASTYLFGGKFPQIDRTLQWMAYVVPAIAISNVLAFHYLVVDRKENLLNAVVFSAVPLSLTAGYFLSKHYGALGMAAAWVAVEWYVSCALIIILTFGFKRSK